MPKPGQGCHPCPGFYSAVGLYWRTAAERVCHSGISGSGSEGLCPFLAALSLRESGDLRARGDLHLRRQVLNALVEHLGMNVACRRAHADLRGNGVLVEGHLEFHGLRLSDRGEMAGGLLDHSLNLALLDLNNAQRLAQLVKVAGVRRENHDLPAWLQDAGELGSVTRSEDHHDRVHGLVLNRQARPSVRDDSADARVSLGQALDRRGGNI